MKTSAEAAIQVQLYFEIVFDRWRRICEAVKLGLFDEDEAALFLVAWYGEGVTVLYELIQTPGWAQEPHGLELAARSIKTLDELEGRLALFCEGIVDLRSPPTGRSIH